MLEVPYFQFSVENLSLLITLSCVIARWVKFLFWEKYHQVHFKSLICYKGLAQKPHLSLTILRNFTSFHSTKHTCYYNPSIRLEAYNFTCRFCPCTSQKGSQKIRVPKNTPSACFTQCSKLNYQKYIYFLENNNLTTIFKTLHMGLISKVSSIIYFWT